MSVNTLTTGGILRAAEVVEIAAASGLNLACAATMLEKESSGGHNLWGRDGVDTGGTYVKGSAVTKSAYLAYKARRGELGSQGVGPCQLTYYTLQNAADELGGCWDWRCNVRVGFAHLAGLIGQHGERGGFRRYNGSGAAAEKYADDAMARLAKWRQQLGAAPAPAGGGVPDTLREGDTGAVVARLQGWLNRMYPAYSKIDLAPQRYGPQTVAVIREFQRRSGVTGADADGRTTGPRTWAALLAAGYRP